LTVCHYYLCDEAIGFFIQEIVMRLFIDINPEQHQHLKAAAALQGQSIKNYVLERALPQCNDQEALNKLEVFLGVREDKAKAGKISTSSVDSIFAEELAKAK
jgi:hypothetical protein